MVQFVDDGRGVDIIIPPNILGDAKGLAIFTVLKAGFLFSGRAGSGIVVARLPDGSKVYKHTHTHKLVLLTPNRLVGTFCNYDRWYGRWRTSRS